MLRGGGGQQTALESSREWAYDFRREEASIEPTEPLTSTLTTRRTTTAAADGGGGRRRRRTTATTTGGGGDDDDGTA